MRRIWKLALGLVVTAALCGPVVFAQGPGGQTAAQSEFVPVSPGELNQEQLPAARLVYAAYAVVWIALLMYVLSLWRRLSRVERDLHEVQVKLGGRR